MSEEELRDVNWEEYIVDKDKGFRVNGGYARPHFNQLKEDLEDVIKAEKAAKPPLSMLQGFVEALDEVARVCGMGANKYARNAWRDKPYKYSERIDSLYRHLGSWVGRKETRDSESGLHHLAHAAWNVLMLLEYELEGLGEDDR